MTIEGRVEMAQAVVEYRPTTDADLAAEWEVFNKAQGGLYREHGFARNDMPFDRFATAHRHLLAHDQSRCFVAQAGQRVIAFTAAIVRNGTWFLSALFVDPDFQGRGIGNALFELAAEDWPNRRLTITDAIQPVSNALYARAGLLPSTPILVMGGSPLIRRQPDLEPGPPTAADFAALDMVGYGFDRAVDHEYWASQSSATVWRRNGEAFAYSYISPQGWLGPLVGRDEVAAVQALEAELSRSKQVMLEIPGSAAGLVEVAFTAGLRIINPPGLLLHSRPAKLPTTVVISGYWLL
jgi:GNAT superfamily N-acetyltransferase